MIDAFYALPFWQKYLVGVCITPASVIVVRLVFESTLLSFRSASLSFIPGDFFLALCFASATTGYGQIGGWGHSWWWAALTFVATLVVLDNQWKRERKDYKREGDQDAHRSPAKRYHDILAYVGYGWVMGCQGIPTLMYGPTLMKLGVAAGLGAWIAMCALDRPRGTVRPVTCQVIDWQPIWRSKKIRLL
ncbi:MAG: hypothetical protein LBG75_00230 [Candidatus Nomurabacteria bacterium]|nr:hypothetical protein [Candidatus Nomurabacteria bacterium]